MRFDIDVSQIASAYWLIVCCAGIVCLCSDFVKVRAKDCRSHATSSLRKQDGNSQPTIWILYSSVRKTRGLAEYTGIRCTAHMLSSKFSMKPSDCCSTRFPLSGASTPLNWTFGARTHTVEAEFLTGSYKPERNQTHEGRQPRLPE